MLIVILFSNIAFEKIPAMRNKLIQIILLAFSTLAIFANTAPTQLSFEHFPYQNKLPSNSVRRIYNDREGYMWFCTNDGLCRFDGYEVKTFRSSSSNPNRLTNNSIECIAEDNQNRLWIGTQEGINILDKRNYSIIPFNHPDIKRNRIACLCSDRKGNVWIGIENNGIVRVAPDGSSCHFLHNPKRPGSLPDNNVIQIAQDNQGRIWTMFWRKGMALYREKSNDFIALPPVGTTNNPYSILQDKENHLWVATWGDGLFSLDLSALPGNPFTPVTCLKNGKPVEVDKIVYSMVQDLKMGYLWTVTYSGLDVFEKIDNKTLNQIDTRSMFKEISSKSFHQIVKDTQGNLWLGTETDGIYKLDFNKPSIQSNPLTAIQEDMGFTPHVIKLCETSDNLIYLALDRAGLYVYNPKTGEVRSPLNPVLKNFLSISTIRRIKSTHEIWITTLGNENIYVISDKEGEKSVMKVFPLEKVLREITINCFFEDSRSNVWIGTNNGLFQKSFGGNVKLVQSNINSITVVNEDKKGNIWVGSDKQGLFKLQKGVGKQVYSKMSVYSRDAANLQSNSIRAICCRKNGQICIGTREGSIYLYNEQTNSLKDVSRLYGITDESVLDILEDDAGILWISTVKKIIRFNPDTHVATYYTKNDGIEVSSFSKDVCVKLQNGTVMFGGNNGLCMFSPRRENPISQLQPKVAITNIEIQNRNIFDNGNDDHFEEKGTRLTLHHDEDNLNLEFSALIYSGTEKIQYAYKLNGIDDRWIYLGNNRRFVNYGNLPAGKYLFQVKATNEDGIWSNRITSLEVVKLPPLYRTWWAYLIYLILLALAGYFIINRIRLKNALRISRIEQEKSEELAQTKLRYFTNISHDLLTPLTIIGLLTNEFPQVNQADKARAELINANVNRLKRLIKQILTFRKNESGNMKLQVQEADAVSFVREVSYSNFQPLITEKKITFSIESEQEHFPAYFDKDKLDKILYNLLSNAFKFTPWGGSIGVNITFPVINEGQWLRLSVSDTGVGISPEDLPHIFTRFFISSHSDQSQSNGIGLSLTKDLIQIHKGNIRVESKVGEGALFTVELPIFREAYSEDEISNETQMPEKHDFDNQNASESLIEQKSEEQKSSGRSHLLVVEDNHELRNIIVKSLSKESDVSSAENGLQALEVIRENDIDLVVSDVMMSEMDGLTLCRKLKTDVATSHIDVLLLTAKIAADDQVDYYNAGADAYIPKPFDLKVLEARVKNLIAKRAQRTEKFRTSKEVLVSSMEYNSLDEEFLKTALEVVENNMADFDFDFNQFAVKMNRSKSTMYRKLKSLTSMSPVEFINNVRLKHACQMLVNTNNQISDIAYQVGFDPKYFSSCFKAEYNMTPREYRQNQQKGQTES